MAILPAEGHPNDVGGDTNLVLAGDKLQTQGGSVAGIYNFKPYSGNLAPTQLATSDYMQGNGGSVATNDKVYVTQVSDFGSDGEIFGCITGYSMDEWQSTGRKYIVDATLVATAMTYDASTDKIYGCFSNSTQTGYEFGTLDLSSRTPQRTKIRSIASKYVAMADNDSGTLYAIDVQGSLYTVSESTGEATLVGSTGVAPSSLIQSAVYNPTSGKILWAAQLSSTSSALYEVDPTTATATKLGDFPNGEEFASLFISKPLAADDAPAAVTSLTPHFEGPSTTGTVSFQLPSTTFAGGELTGDLSWYLLADGDTVATGSGTAGSEVTTPEVTVANDYVEFAVLTRNDAGFSPKYKQSAFIGPATPMGIWEAKASVGADNKATISWQKSEGAINDGYFVQDSVTYNVVRYPDEVTIATGVKDTTITDQLPSSAGIKSYYWRITPVFMGNEGTYAESNKVLVGNGYDIPYFEPFDEGWIDRYTVIDANGDYTTWWDDYSGHAYTQAGPDNGSDDWLITPDIHFAPGIYTIAFRYWGGLPGYSEYAGNAFEVGFGQGTDPSKFKTVGKVTDIILDESQQKEFSATVKVSADGTYNVGIHDISPNNAYLLYIDSLSITQGGTLEVPDTVGSLRATADPDGDLKVNISFTAPSKNANGDALDALDHVFIVRDDKDTIKTFDAPVPGAELSFEDTEATGLTDGPHTYTVFADNDKGKGLTSSVRVTTGVEVPGYPSDVAIHEEGNHIHVTWKAPTQSASGHAIDPKSVKYNVYVMKYYTQELIDVASNVDATSYDDSTTFDLNGDQYQIYYIIEAVNRAGTSEQIMSNQIIVGAPDSLPYHEGFDPATPNQMEHLWWIDLTQDINTMSFFGFQTGMSSDGDDGCAVFIGGQQGCFGNLRTGKISLKNTVDPKLTFDYYCTSNEDAQLTVQASSDLSSWADLYTISYDSINVDEVWHQATVDLSSLTGYDYVYLRFHAMSNNADSPVAIDNVRISDETTNCIRKPAADAVKLSDVYTVDGKLVRRGATTLRGLAPGLYIVNGKKVVVR
jgi:hypothetical protein